MSTQQMTEEEAVEMIELAEEKLAELRETLKEHGTDSIDFRMALWGTAFPLKELTADFCNYSYDDA